MTVSPPAASGPVLMTEAEARQAVDRIKASAEDIAATLIDLRDREGHRALGYETWQECIRAEFHMSRSYAHRLINAHLIERVLALPIGNAKGLPESHSRALAPLLDEPETLRAAYATAVEESGGKPTAARVADVVERIKPCVRSTKPPRPVSPTRHADPDVSQDSPDADVNQDPEHEAGARCGQCGDRFTGAACPCAAAPVPADEYPAVAEQPCTECRGEIVVLSEQDDRARGRSIAEALDLGRPIVQLCETCLLGEDGPAQPVNFGQADVPLTGRGRPEADDHGGQSVATATDAGEVRLPASTPAPPASLSADETVTQRYLLGLEALLPLTALDPVSVVEGLDADQLQTARERHQTIRTWLADLDYQIFLAERRAGQDHALAGAR